MRQAQGITSPAPADFYPAVSLLPIGTIGTKYPKIWKKRKTVKSLKGGLQSACVDAFTQWMSFQNND